ncbi:protein SCAI homolog isoform X1 [Dendrobium catenatum]|uniref:protein SCAI homolog isoform X1 n=1 Tax=Dendrobium catenatum TaxID=906689 RepID=UPI0009F1A1CF|nr:protein SCAI homolog isoform X1 [Dendrobium catenatum]
MAQGQGTISATEHFWFLLDKGDRKFSRIRELPNFGRARNDADFQKAFKIYTQLWKLQQENRQKLVEAGLKRWEIGEIASRIAQLYYFQYQRTSDSGNLLEAYVFYEAILTREYFRDSAAASGGSAPDPALANKQLRFFARFLIVCLVLGRRDMVSILANHLRTLVDESRRSFQEIEYKEWKHVVQEIIRFLKLDTSFMNMRPLRYSFVYDTHPDSLPVAASYNSRKGLVLRDAILSSYCHNEVKFAELTLDTFRMLQCLEWEPCGSFSLNIATDSNYNGMGPNRVNLLQDIRDSALPPNPHKVILYRPTITYFLVVLATICEELPPDGILLIYLSASGEIGENYPMLLSSKCSVDAEKQRGDSTDAGMTSPQVSPIKNPFDTSSQSKESYNDKEEAFLWLGSRGIKGSNSLHPCDLIPFTRKPLFLIIDSNNSHAFKVIHGEEKGETMAMLLSPTSQSPAMGAASESSRNQNISQFTMFLTAPVQAFCILLGVSGINMEKETYNNAEKLFSSSLNDWENALLASDELHPIWIEVLGDPFLRRFLLRFVFCRSVLALYNLTFHQEEFLPSCLPDLPDCLHPESDLSESVVLALANFFGVNGHFVFSKGTKVLELMADHRLLVYT